MLNAQQFPTSKFVTRLSSFPTIAAMIGGGIWFGTPNTDDSQNNTPIEIYMSCFLVSNPPDLNTRFARVQCTLIGSRQTIPAELEDIFQEINNQIITDCGTVRDMDGFYIIDIEEGNTFGPAYDMDRVMLQKDYLIYYIA